jgi:hypothetical protein
MFPAHFSRFARPVPVDGRFRWFHVMRRAGLNFNGAKDISVSSDQVNFTPTTRQPKVARHHHIAASPQRKVSVSSSPDVPMSRGFVRWAQPARPPCQDAEPSSCASSGKQNGTKQRSTQPTCSPDAIWRTSYRNLTGTFRNRESVASSVLNRGAGAPALRIFKRNRSRASC